MRSGSPLLPAAAHARAAPRRRCCAHSTAYQSKRTRQICWRRCARTSASGAAALRAAICAVSGASRAPSSTHGVASSTSRSDGALGPSAQSHASRSASSALPLPPSPTKRAAMCANMAAMSPPLPLALASSAPTQRARRAQSPLASEACSATQCSACGAMARAPPAAPSARGSSARAKLERALCARCSVARSPPPSDSTCSSSAASRRTVHPPHPSVSGCGGVHADGSSTSGRSASTGAAAAATSARASPAPPPGGTAATSNARRTAASSGRISATSSSKPARSYCSSKLARITPRTPCASREASPWRSRECTTPAHWMSERHDGGCDPVGLTRWWRIASLCTRTSSSLAAAASIPSAPSDASASCASSAPTATSSPPSRCAVAAVAPRSAAACAGASATSTQRLRNARESSPCPGSIDMNKRKSRCGTTRRISVSTCREESSNM